MKDPVSHISTMALASRFFSVQHLGRPPRQAGPSPGSKDQSRLSRNLCISRFTQTAGRGNNIPQFAIQIFRQRPIPIPAIDVRERVHRPTWHPGRCCCCSQLYERIAICAVYPACAQVQRRIREVCLMYAASYATSGLEHGDIEALRGEETGCA